MHQPFFRAVVLKSSFFTIAILLAPGFSRVKATTLSDNLSTANAGTEAVSGTNWVAASFSTDASAYRLESNTLSLANITPGSAELDLYSGAGQPASMLAALTSPLFYTSSLSPSTFTGSGTALSPNSTYWLVLKAPSGEFDWGWTDDPSGTGVGFTHTWGASDDAGSTWFTADVQPMQLRVTATPASAIPEPGTSALILIGAAMLFESGRFRGVFGRFLGRGFGSGPKS